MNSGPRTLTPLEDGYAACDPGLGGSPVGEEPFGGNPPFGIASAVAVRENAIRVRFTIPMVWTQIGTAGDAADPRNYAVYNDPATSGFNGDAARAAFPVAVELPDEPDGFTVLLILDRPLTPWPALYAVSADGVRGVGGEVACPCVVSLQGLYRETVPRLTSRAQGGRDIASPQFTGGGIVGGGIPVGDDGDYGVDQFTAAVRKRVIRRVVSAVSGFAHIPDFGVGAVAEVKRSATPGRLSDLTARAETQVLADPDVVRAKVTLVDRGGGVFSLVILAQTKAGDVFRANVPVST